MHLGYSTKRATVVLASLWVTMAMVAPVSAADSAPFSVPRLPPLYSSAFKVEYYTPIEAGGARFHVYCLASNLSKADDPYLQVRQAVLVANEIPAFGMTTSYFSGNYYASVDSLVKRWPPFQGPAKAAYVLVRRGTGGMGYGFSRDEVLELSAGGARSLLDMVESTGLNGTLFGLAYSDSWPDSPLVILQDDSLFTSESRERLPFPTSKSSFPGFPRVLQIEEYRIQDITTKLNDRLKEKLVRLAESGWFVGEHSIIWDESWDLPASGRALSVNDVLSIPEFPYAPDSLSFAVSVLATYYAVGWPDEGEAKFAQMISRGDWPPGFAQGIDATASECVQAVRLLFQ